MADSKAIIRATNVVAMQDQVKTSTGIDGVSFWHLRVMGEASGVIRIEYVGVWHYDFNSGDTIERVLTDFLNSNPRPWETPTNNEPKRSTLSIQSERNRYHAFVLDTINCQFSQYQVAFFIDENRKDYYGYPRSVWKDDVIGQLHFDRMPSGGANAKAAFFLAARYDDPRKDPAAFNIQLDVVDSQGGVIPISIDPDVGYPGGNS